MGDTSQHFRMPPKLRNPSGEYRKVGFELEFTGLTLEQTAATLLKVWGGEIERISAAESILHTENLGDFTIELDWNYLKNKAADDAKNEPSPWLELLSHSAAMLVPVEIVCPPIPLNRLDQIEPLVPALRQAGAAGTKDSMIAAYGVHINTEIPRLDAANLEAYLQAFSLLQWWLIENHEINFTRRLSPYIDLYPEAYLQKLFRYQKPSIELLLADYLEHNASRNRALDLLPLLATIDSGRVQRAVGDNKIQARPAFHYRLPDCHIEQPSWSLAQAWNSWLTIERLAEEATALKTLREKFLALDRPLLGVSRSDWIKVMAQWINDHSLA